MMNFEIHNELVQTFREFVVELNRDELAFPESLVIIDEGWNIEVIYTNDVILLQENGDKIAGAGRRWFVWCNHEGLGEVVDII